VNKKRAIPGCSLAARSGGIDGGRYLVMNMLRNTAAMSAIGVTLVMGAMIAREARSQSRVLSPPASLAAASDGFISGVVTSSKGSEAGVWVIAETTDLPTKFRKIVVTDDRGRYVLPQLPTANYKVWVRGYGLVDSASVESAPGKTLALTAVIAPSPQAAAQYYPASYWYSLINLPPKSAFPLKIRTGESEAAARDNSSGNFAAIRGT
jgi:hypothetical protein